MKTKAIPSQWLIKNGHRMDCNPYMGGAVEARAILEKLACQKQPLHELTAGYNGGIYNGPVFRRRYVDDPEYGVPFLTSGTMLRADLSDIPYLSKVDAKSNKLSYLELKPGMIMISCSGAIGNMVYVRGDMDGYWSCQDQLKVVADNDKVQSGYLYAFLKSKYGLPIVISGTYGAIIQHIEPQHIAALPVPRLGDTLESEIHRLVEEAAELRVEAVNEISEASHKVEKLLGWHKLPLPSSGVKENIVSSKKIHAEGRIDVLFYSKDEEHVSQLLDKHNWEYLENISSIVKPGMFKRIMSTKEDGGIAFHTGSELFLMEVKPKYYVSARTQNIEQCLLEPYWILIQAFGQRGGLICRAMMTTDILDGASATDLQIQVKLDNKYDAGFVFAYLNSSPGYISLIRTPVGGSIPHIHPKDIRSLKVFWPDESTRHEIGKLAVSAWDNKDKAQRLEEKAIKILEDTITNLAGTIH